MEDKAEIMSILRQWMKDVLGGERLEWVWHSREQEANMQDWNDMQDNF